MEKKTIKKRIHIATEESKAIGLRIRELRISSNLTQKKLGELASISGNHISSIETGVENISDDAISRIAEALKTSFSYLKNGDLVALRKVEKSKTKKEKETIKGQITFADLGWS